ncbi:MAG: hypothetical protein HKN63_11715 [Rhodobacteraceae bacterium]|nr:hypothetical protein [Paracoccaceae bacterium]
MKIVENTPDELILRSRPVVLLTAFWLIGCATLYLGYEMPEDPNYSREFTFAAGAFIIFFAWRALPSLTVKFDRPGEVVVRQVRRITGTTTEVAPLVSVKSAKVRSAWRQAAFLNRIMLLTTEGPASLENGFVGMRRQRIAEVINKWLARAS